MQIFKERKILNYLRLRVEFRACLCYFSTDTYLLKCTRFCDKYSCQFLCVIRTHKSVWRIFLTD